MLSYNLYGWIDENNNKVISKEPPEDDIKHLMTGVNYEGELSPDLILELGENLKRQLDAR